MWEQKRPQQKKGRKKLASVASVVVLQSVCLQNIKFFFAMWMLSWQQGSSFFFCPQSVSVTSINQIISHHTKRTASTVISLSTNTNISNILEFITVFHFLCLPLQGLHHVEFTQPIITITAIIYLQSKNVELLMFTLSFDVCQLVIRLSVWSGAITLCLAQTQTEQSAPSA